MKNGNTIVTSLPTLTQLKVRSMATKCFGRCGACLYCGSFGQFECAEIASADEKKVA